ncbi:hypothetical protein [Plebeiibacterium sediminum]|uniref:Uncharacterized protein n=1 Tax=Plebeiibacterium sediminum TaxID=2992112 RepID=A0AAE3M6E7_9BACT|nr:hypothetical protein [Plebeiobacterium sediminum]MCW3787928.1 hypothetical protein [Plebeiobacterium sediminum]
MNKAFGILFFILSILSQVNGQDCYKEDLKNVQNIDFSSIFDGITYQGIIGNSYQRIEIKFIETTKDNNNPSTYQVKGKSKVNNNICDFEGTFWILKATRLDTENELCEGPDIYDGTIEGKYRFKENPNQSHVGIFEGDFYIQWNKIDKRIEHHVGWLSDSEPTKFIGTWTEYGKNTLKKCNWSRNVPPESLGELFKYWENGYYLINQKYFNRGWESYAISGLNRWLIIPLDFESFSAKIGEDKEYSDNDINNARANEQKEWWK